MHRQLLQQALIDYAASGLAYLEEVEKIHHMAEFIAEHKDCFERSCTGHITSSAWVVNAPGTHALLTHHRKLDKWLQLGGHNDGDHDCARVALKEAEEESGIVGLKLYNPHIFDIDIHPLPNACAYHYDVRYVIQAPENAQYAIGEESLDLAWVAVEKISEIAPFRSVIRMQEKWMRNHL